MMKAVAPIVSIVALGFVGVGLWKYMNYGALAPVGILLWADLTIWSLKRRSIKP